jgi:exopolyphosphatase/guanosine-5'-triphosphate,3'-diphosphate pyrophosphatase
MREAVLDIGSNTGHLLVVDAHRGAAPLPASSTKEPLRLAEHLTGDGAISESGVEALLAFIERALVEAEDQGCESVLAFATSAIREASNADDVIRTVMQRTNVDLTILTGPDEARLTFPPSDGGSAGRRAGWPSSTSVGGRSRSPPGPRRAPTSRCPSRSVPAG